MIIVCRPILDWAYFLKNLGNKFIILHKIQLSVSLRLELQNVKKVIIVLPLSSIETLEVEISE